MNRFIIAGIFLSFINANANQLSMQSEAERGALFYNFDDSNKTKDGHKKSNTDINKHLTDIANSEILLAKLVDIAQKQLDTQNKILELLSSEFDPTPKKVIVDGKECIENSSADCFVMPLTRDAKKIPVLKDMLVNPTPETAKNYLQWQAKYLSTGPFKVGRSFQYAMNTYGEEAYPMNITRSDNNTNTNILGGKRDEMRLKLLNDLYKQGTLKIYIFLESNSLGYFAMTELSKLIDSIEYKSALTIVFKTQKDKDDYMLSAKSLASTEKAFASVKSIVDANAFKLNNIYMTPTYMVTSKVNDVVKKQAIAVGRVSVSSFNAKAYEWLEQENIIKRGGLSDYKLWQLDKGDNKNDK